MSNENCERWWFDESTNTVRDENRLTVALLPGEFDGSTDGDMLAAAPAMLDALKALLADKYLADPINADRMAEARAAVDSAEGR